MEFLDMFLRAFIPMFVAVDAVGVAPFFIALTAGMTPRARRKIVAQSIVTALIVTFAFAAAGGAVFDFLGVELYDFMIAGGAVILILASLDIVSREKPRAAADPAAGIVPLGTPLLAGPAVLATALITIKPYGAAAAASIALNFIIAGLVFLFSDGVVRLIGAGGARALSKIMAIILCAYGVMLVRKGILLVVNAV
ncbi:MAG: MarC family protein [bacterium]